MLCGVQVEFTKCENSKEDEGVCYGAKSRKAHTRTHTTYHTHTHCSRGMDVGCLFDPLEGGGGRVHTTDAEGLIIGLLRTKKNKIHVRVKFSEGRGANQGNKKWASLAIVGMTRNMIY